MNIEFVPSPNFVSPRTKRKIRLIVIHATEDKLSLAQEERFFQDPGSRVSAHYIIDKSGGIVQMVWDEDVAWHAGESEWQGITGVNSISIGIELTNLNDGQDAYPLAQMVSCADLCAEKVKKYQIELPVGIVGHKDVAPGRKTDPAGFDWDAFRKMVGERLV